MKVRLPSLCLLLALAAAQPSPAQTTESEAKFLDQVRREARDHSAAGEYAFYLTDVHGPRLSGSPAFRKAAEWAAQTLRQTGLDNVGTFSATSAEWTEPGWGYQRYGVRLLEPGFATLLAIPAPYSPPTGGRLVGEPIQFLLPGRSGLSVDEIMARFRGTLKNKILLLSDQIRPIAEAWRPVSPSELFFPAPEG